MNRRVFVARERELARLQALLDRALTETAQVCFIIGEAGVGKSSLLTEFTRRAQKANPDLVYAISDCNAQTGLGDPYHPFHKMLALLTGEVESASTKNEAENTNRLKAMLKVSGATVLELAPDVLGLFVPGEPFSFRGILRSYRKRLAMDRNTHYRI